MDELVNQSKKEELWGICEGKYRKRRDKTRITRVKSEQMGEQINELRDIERNERRQ